MTEIKLTGYNIKETVVTWQSATPGIAEYITTPVSVASFYTMLSVQPAHRFLSVPRGYTVTLTARNADTGELLFTRYVSKLWRIACKVPAGIRVRFSLSFDASEHRLIPFKWVWNPRVSLFVGAGTSGRVVDETIG